jgi:hypothetical protein
VNKLGKSQRYTFLNNVLLVLDTVVYLRQTSIGKTGPGIRFSKVQMGFLGEQICLPIGREEKITRFSLF